MTACAIFWTRRACLALALALCAPFAATQPAPAFELCLSTFEPRIRDGQLETVLIEKRFALEPWKVARSREHAKISSTLEPDLARLFASLERRPEGARFVLEAGAWVARQRSGWRVDATATRAALLAAIRSDANSARIALEVTRPEPNVEDWFGQGIRFHFGGGSSSFRGSPSFRVQNIIAGSRQLDGLYLEPGAVFNFNQSVRVRAGLGFVPGWVISQGTLVKALGGGICQVATTAFRAAYHAGLPILERHEHSYRVHYYDPPGTDATTSASKNLRFRNDTGGPLYLQVSWDLRAQTLSMNFFGPRPDRRVQVSNPFIFNRRPAPGPRFIADPSVPVGRTWRVDLAEPGMSVTVARTVTLETGEVRRDLLRSDYVPWGAIYAINPRDPRWRP